MAKKTRAPRRTPRTARARRDLGRVETAVAYTRGVSKHVVREYPKSTGFVAGVAAAFAVLEVLA